MALLINGSLRDGRQSLVNVEQLVSFSLSNDGITYTPSFGYIQGGYPPCLVSCKKEFADIIYAEILEFVATHSYGMYNAHKRLSELRKEELKQIKEK